MNTFSKNLLTALMGVALLSSCSRPVAYFQKSQRETFATKTLAPAVAATSTDTKTPAVQPVQEVAVVAKAPMVQPNQAQVALAQLNAVVSNDNKLATDKSVRKRMNRVKQLLVSATQKNAVNTAPDQPQKMNLVQRMMVKKMNKRINNQLAPENPNKPMANTSILVVGAIAVIVGLVLLLVGSSNTIGIIVLLAGAVVLLLGLLSGR